MSLGLITYVSAYVLIELLSLFIAPLKSWRVAGGDEGRAKLVRAARWTTLAMATYHASALVSTMNSMGDGNILNDNSLGFRSLLVLTLVAGLFLTIWILDMLSAKGIGHGVSILFLTTEIGGLPRELYRWLSVSLGAHKITQISLPLLLLAGLVLLIIVVEKTVRRIPFRRTDGTNVLVPIKLTTAGTIPLEWAGWIIGLPALILGVLSAEEQAKQHVLQQLVGAAASRSLESIVAYGIVLLVFYYVFTAFFHNPRMISSYIDRTQGIGDLSSEALRAVDRSLEVMALAGSLYIFLLAYVQDALWAWFSIPLIMDGLSLLLVGCIILDIVNEVRLRWRSGSLVRIAELHEPWKAGFLQNMLREQNILSVIRGYHHRSLLYFFGPYVEMSLLVSQEQAEKARDIIKDYTYSVPKAVTSSS